MKHIQDYLILKGFLLNSETGSGGFANDVGTNPFNGSYGSRIPNTILTQGTFGTNSFTFSATCRWFFYNLLVISNYFGLGTLTNGGATPYDVRVIASQSFSDNYSDQTPDQLLLTFTTSSLTDYTPFQ